ncbi:WXG100 family type VII secretion target [Nocardia sp. NPDC005366]|uniref:WXG100 family type VII secretion target n=1 Tax=Nocardia sp. NPDC005366 TaxID=3156878 RepID=UPI0033B34406
MSGDDRFRVDLEQLDAAITTMEQFGREVGDWLGEVDRHIAELHLSWSSEAASAQRATHEQWALGVDEMAENLDELKEVARRAHTNYSTAISLNQKMWP